MSIAYYINYHTYPNEAPRRIGAPSAIVKANYVIGILATIYDEVEIVSPSWTIEKYRGFAAGKNVIVERNISISYPPSIGGTGLISRCLKHIVSRMWLVFRLLRIKQNATIFLYHQPTLMFPIGIVSKIKRFILIIEDEEIYENGQEIINEKQVKKELTFLRNANAYIFPTEALHQLVNTSNKPYVISHGTYLVEKNVAKRFLPDNKIHVVYAGTFNAIKGGAFAAIDAGRYLDEQYHLHIIGFGNEEETRRIIRSIQEASVVTSCSITYDGMLSGEDYIRLLQSCHIGLSTQNPEAAFNATSFPSKILSYLANGLRVVSVAIAVLKTSSINDLLYYYTENTPESIANAIRLVDIHNDYDSRNRISQLNKEFTTDMYKMLKKGMIQ